MIICPEKSRLSDNTTGASGFDTISAAARLGQCVARAATLAPETAARPFIHLIEDDPALREAGRVQFESAGWAVCDYFSAEAFLSSPRPRGDVCLVIDVMLPGIDGLTLLKRLRSEGYQAPAIMLTGRDDAATAVAALKAGAADYIEKPARRTRLLASIADAVERARDAQARDIMRFRAKQRFMTLTPREYDVLMMVLDGALNKNIAVDLKINQRTVENHRANVMRKTGVGSLPELVRLFIEANAPY